MLSKTISGHLPWPQQKFAKARWDRTMTGCRLTLASRKISTAAQHKHLPVWKQLQLESWQLTVDITCGNMGWYLHLDLSLNEGASKLALSVDATAQILFEA